MAKIEIEIADDVLERAQHSADAGRLPLGVWLAQAINRTAQIPSDTVLGMFEDAPELMDAVIEDAMAARETVTLRAAHG